MAGPFHPLPLLGNAHLQTLVGNLVSGKREPASVTRRVALPDGDALALEVTTPPGWRPLDPTVVLLHGLTGSHRSSYLVRLARKLARRSLRAIRVNLRGQGSGVGLARRPYHAGCSDDVRVVLETLRAEAPTSPLALVGFSLGGNIALKLAAELEPGARDLVQGVLAACPAADLEACWRRIAHPRNWLYHATFVRGLRAAVVEKEARFPDLERVSPRLPRRLTLFEFDDRYTAPQWGFGGATVYYRRASAAPLLERVEVPARIVLALDDPIIDPAPFGGLLPDAVEVVRSPRGGHLGFVGRPDRAGGLRWLDGVVLSWLERTTRHG